MQETFRFKNFSICQKNSAMKVGTDGVLLGAWANGGEKILDIGAGTGLISLMMAQRFPKALVTGVEIDCNAAEEAEENVKNSPFSDRVIICKSSLQDFAPSLRFDSIVTNPPYYSHGFRVNDDARRMARQAESLTFADIIGFTKRWLIDKGELSVVLPIDAVESFIGEAAIQGMFLSRQYIVKTLERKKAKRTLLAFSTCRHSTFDYKEVSLLDDVGEKSKWYRELTEDFYLL